MKKIIFILALALTALLGGCGAPVGYSGGYGYGYSYPYYYGGSYGYYGGGYRYYSRPYSYGYYGRPYGYGYYGRPYGYARPYAQPGGIPAAVLPGNRIGPGLGMRPSPAMGLRPAVARPVGKPMNPGFGPGWKGN